MRRGAGARAADRMPFGRALAQAMNSASVLAGTCLVATTATFGNS